MSDSSAKNPELADGLSAPGAFARFVEEYYKAAFCFALSLCGKHDEACDLTQQAFYIAQTKGHQLRDASKLKQWLFTVLRREFLSARRHESAHPQDNLELRERDLPLVSADHAASMDGKTVLTVLQSLDENFKMPLTLFYLEQLSYKEIADALEIPIGTVMSRLARGKMMLRQQLEARRVLDQERIVPFAARHLGEGTNG